MKAKKKSYFLGKIILTKSRNFDKNVNLEIQDAQQAANRANSKSLGPIRRKLKISNKQVGLISLNMS